MRKRTVFERSKSGAFIGRHVRDGKRVYMLPERDSYPPHVFVEGRGGLSLTIYTGRLMTSYAGLAFALPEYPL